MYRVKIAVLKLKYCCNQKKEIKKTNMHRLTWGQFETGFHWFIAWLLVQTIHPYSGLYKLIFSRSLHFLQSFANIEIWVHCSFSSFCKKGKFRLCLWKWELSTGGGTIISIVCLGTRNCLLGLEPPHSVRVRGAANYFPHAFGIGNWTLELKPLPSTRGLGTGKILWTVSVTLDLWCRKWKICNKTGIVNLDVRRTDLGMILWNWNHCGLVTGNHPLEL